MSQTDSLPVMPWRKTISYTLLTALRHFSQRNFHVTTRHEDTHRRWHHKYKGAGNCQVYQLNVGVCLQIRSKHADSIRFGLWVLRNWTVNTHRDRAARFISWHNWGSCLTLNRPPREQRLALARESTRETSTRPTNRDGLRRICGVVASIHKSRIHLAQNKPA